MNEHDYSNRLVLGLAVVGVVFFGSMALVWGTGGRLSTEAKAAPVPHVDATAGLEKRLAQLEAKTKAPPTFDSSQLDAQLNELKSQLGAVQTQLGAFKASDFDALKTKIDSAKIDSAKIDSARTANSESIKTKIDALQTDVGNLHTRFDQLSQQVASVTAPDSKQNSQKSHHSKSK